MKVSEPYRGIKRDLDDGGIHVPMIIQWLAAIAKARVGHMLWAFADLLPTLADVAGVSPDSVPRVRANGVSIRGLLQDIPAPLPNRVLYEEFGKQLGDPNYQIVGEVFQTARRGKWKAVRYGMESPVVL